MSNYPTYQVASRVRHADTSVGTVVAFDNSRDYDEFYRVEWDGGGVGWYEAAELTFGTSELRWIEA